MLRAGGSKLKVALQEERARTRFGVQRFVLPRDLEARILHLIGHVYKDQEYEKWCLGCSLISADFNRAFLYKCEKLIKKCTMHIRAAVRLPRKKLMFARTANFPGCGNARAAVLITHPGRMPSRRQIRRANLLHWDGCRTRGSTTAAALQSLNFKA